MCSSAPARRLVDRPAALRGAARALAPLGIGRGIAERDPGDDRKLAGDAQQLAPARLVLELDSVDAAGEPFLDRGQQDEHQRRAGVDVPVRHRPDDLAAASRVELVGACVAVVVILLAGQHEDVRSGAAEPRFGAGIVVLLRELLEQRRIVDDEQTLPL
jgi:hypothetical protein